MAADPFIQRDPGDLITADDWNEIQVRGREEVSAVRESVDETSLQVDTLRTEAQALGQRVDDFGANHAAYEQDIGMLVGRVGELEQGANALDNRVQLLDQRVDGLADTVRELTEGPIVGAGVTFEAFLIAGNSRSLERWEIVGEPIRIRLSANTAVTLQIDGLVTSIREVGVDLQIFVSVPRDEAPALLVPPLYIWRELVFTGDFERADEDLLAEISRNIQNEPTSVLPAFRFERTDSPTPELPQEVRLSFAAMFHLPAGQFEFALAGLGQCAVRAALKVILSPTDAH